MKYSVTVNGTDLELELEGESVRIGTESWRAHLADIDGGPLRMLTLGDAVHRVQLRAGDGRGRYTLWIDGYRFDVEALDERARAIRELSASTAKAMGPAPLVAPMPGMIVRINIADGDTVQPGQGLVVMEAMKME